MTQQGSVGLALAGGLMLGLLTGIGTMLLRPRPAPPPPVTIIGPERVVTVTGPRVEVPVDVVRYVSREGTPTPHATECVVMRWRTP